MWVKAKKFFKIASLLVFLLLIVLGGVYLPRSAHFRLAHIEVDLVKTKGIISSEEIIKRSGLLLGENIFKIDLSEVKKRLELHPWVEKAFLARKLPRTIYIKVVEEDPLAMVATRDGVWLVNAQGKLFARANLSLMKDLPALAGVTKEEIKARSLSSSRLPVLELLACLKKHEGLVPPYANISQLQFLSDGFELLTRDALRVRFWGKTFDEYLWAYKKLDRILVYLYETKQYRRIKAVRLDYPRDQAALIFKAGKG